MNLESLQLLSSTVVSQIHQIYATSQILAQLPSPNLSGMHNILNFDDLSVTYLWRTK